MTQQRSFNTRGWIVVLAAVGINLAAGAIYAWSIMAKAIGGQWHWSKAQSAMPFTMATVTFAITMIFAGRMQDKLGPRLGAVTGGLMLGLGYIASSWTQSPIMMMLTMGLVGIGLGLAYSATTPPAIKWFSPARKGLIAGIVVAGVGVAAAYAAPLAQYLIDSSGIGRAFFLLGVGCIAITCLLSLILRNPPAGYVPAALTPAGPSPAKAAAAPRRNQDWNEMLRTPQFYQLWLMFVLTAAAGMMIIVHIATIAKEQAHMEKWGFMPIILLAVFNAVGRVVSGFVSDRIGRTRTMIIAFVLQAVNMFIFSYYTNQSMLIFGAAFAGLCYGTIFTLMPAATADFYGVRNLGVNYGLVFTAFGVAGVLGPVFGGWLRDTYGTFGNSYTVSGLLLLIGAVLAFTTRAPKLPVESETAVPDKVGV